MISTFSPVDKTSHSQFQKSYNIGMQFPPPIKVIGDFLLSVLGRGDATWVFRSLCPSSAAL